MNRRGFFGALAAGVAALFVRGREDKAETIPWNGTMIDGGITWDDEEIPLNINDGPRYYVMGADHAIWPMHGEPVWNGTLWVPLERA